MSRTWRYYNVATRQRWRELFDDYLRARDWVQEHVGSVETYQITREDVDACPELAERIVIGCADDTFSLTRVMPAAGRVPTERTAAGVLAKLVLSRAHDRNLVIVWTAPGEQPIELDDFELRDGRTMLLLAAKHRILGLT